MPQVLGSFVLVTIHDNTLIVRVGASENTITTDRAAGRSDLNRRHNANSDKKNTPEKQSLTPNDEEPQTDDNQYVIDRIIRHHMKDDGTKYVGRRSWCPLENDIIQYTRHLPSNFVVSY